MHGLQREVVPPMNVSQLTTINGHASKFLDTLTPKVSHCSFGRLGVGGWLGYEDKPVTVRGEGVERSISAHAPSRILFELEEQYVSLEVSAAFNDDVPLAADVSADFEVYVDGRLSAKVRGLRPGGEPIPLSVQLKGSRWLELAINTEHRRWAHTLWVNPRLYSTDGDGACTSPVVEEPQRKPPSAISPFAPRNLARPTSEVIGKDKHRSGWPWVLNAISRSDLPILLDDFVEQTFCYRFPRPVHVAPWVGIFHHPPGMPSFADAWQKPQVFFEYPEFQESLRHLRGAIALSEHLASWLRGKLDVPVEVIQHPSDAPTIAWTPDRFAANPDPMLIQVGFYLRNLCAIEQFPARGLQRAKLLPIPHSAQQAWVLDWERRCRELWDRLATRRWYCPPSLIPAADPAQYDVLLSENVVFTEVFDSSANNVVVECIARNTPIVVNDHPAVVEYLGAEYPLYFEAIEEIPSLLSDERIVAAHQYLAALGKEWLSLDVFVNAVLAFCRRIA